MVITAGFGPANSGSIPDMSFKLNDQQDKVMAQQLKVRLCFRNYIA